MLTCGSGAVKKSIPERVEKAAAHEEGKGRARRSFLPPPGLTNHNALRIVWIPIGSDPADQGSFFVGKFVGRIV